MKCLIDAKLIIYYLADYSMYNHVCTVSQAELLSAACLFVRLNWFMPGRHYSTRIINYYEPFDKNNSIVQSLCVVLQTRHIAD